MEMFKTILLGKNNWNLKYETETSAINCYVFLGDTILNVNMSNEWQKLYK